MNDDCLIATNDYIIINKDKILEPKYIYEIRKKIRSNKSNICF